MLFIRSVENSFGIVLLFEKYPYGCRLISPIIINHAGDLR